MNLLNIACGGRFHKDWVNIDFHTASKDVKAVNILGGLPFHRDYFDAIYSSHFFEHLTREQLKFVLSEIYKTLKREGILRIVVPDLENLCREYLTILEKVHSDDSYKEKYDWITIELLDQLVRMEAGGNMAKVYKKAESKENKALRDFIFYRVGVNLSSVEYSGKNTNGIRVKVGKINLALLKEKLLYLYISIVGRLIPRNIRKNIFSKTSIGEKHLWMHDKYSLSRLLREAGFRDIKVLNHNESSISNFNSYLLDINEDGSPYKGVSSLYLECRK